jgi:uncharacterized membrane protein (UPF0127 family)
MSPSLRTSHPLALSRYLTPILARGIVLPTPAATRSCGSHAPMRVPFRRHGERRAARSAIIRLVNESKGTVVATRMRVADNLWSRFWGLMGRRALADGEALLLRPCSSIHTMFMRFPIDVVFIDEGNEVVKVVSNLRPFRLTMAPGSAQSVLELDAGAAAQAKVEPGDLLVMVDAGQE